MGHHKEGIQLGKEGLEIFERLGDATEQAQCLINLTRPLHHDGQLDAAEEAASRAIGLISENGDQYLVAGSHYVLGNIYRSRGKLEKAVHHFEVSLRIVSSFNWRSELFLIHHDLAVLFSMAGKFGDAQAHIERAKPHMIDNAYFLAFVIGLQARLWHRQGRFEEANSEALRAADIFEKLGAAQNLERYNRFLQEIEETMRTPIASNFDGEVPKIVLLPTSTD